MGKPTPGVDLLPTNIANECSSEDSPDGAFELVSLFSVLIQINSQYDYWLRNARIHALDPAAQDNSHYHLLLRNVEEEQASIPVLLFAMIEQVSTAQCACFTFTLFSTSCSNS